MTFPPRATASPLVSLPLAALLATIAIVPLPATAQEGPVSSRLDIQRAQLDAGYWIKRHRDPDRVVLDR
ncbi:MAG: hypothetical protein ACR2J7_08625, partial [Luteimonas sp.]